MSSLRPRSPVFVHRLSQAGRQLTIQPRFHTDVVPNNATISDEWSDLCVRSYYYWACSLVVQCGSARSVGITARRTQPSLRPTESVSQLPQ